MSEEHRKAVGGRWEEMGLLQFDFMVKMGLLPEHRLLDVGCGCLRGGVRFIHYLNWNRYAGVDKNQGLLDAGKTEMLKILSSRAYNIHQSGNFEFPEHWEKFDYALAQSLFTHLAPGMVSRCISAVASVLKPGGRFYATFFDRAMKKELPIETFNGRDPYHLERVHLEYMAEAAGLEISFIGDWDHPMKQQMVEFVKNDTNEKHQT